MAETVLAARKNVGLWADRLAADRDNQREVAFANAWERENERLYDTAHVLVALLYGHGHRNVASCNDSCRSRVTLDPSGLERDRRVAATIIQWLGSNVGFDFLDQALRDCGYEIRRRA